MSDVEANALSSLIEYIVWGLLILAIPTFIGLFLLTWAVAVQLRQEVLEIGDEDGDDL